MQTTLLLQGHSQRTLKIVITQPTHPCLWRGQNFIEHFQGASRRKMPEAGRKIRNECRTLNKELRMSIYGALNPTLHSHTTYQSKSPQTIPLCYLLTSSYWILSYNKRPKWLIVSILYLDLNWFTIAPAPRECLWHQPPKGQCWAGWDQRLPICDLWLQQSHIFNH
jgi:hypothetical protein